MEKLKFMAEGLGNKFAAWAVEIDISTVTLSAAGAIIVWIALKAVGGIIEEYARRIWFGKL